MPRKIKRLNKPGLQAIFDTANEDPKLNTQEVQPGELTRPRARKVKRVSKRNTGKSKVSEASGNEEEQTDVEVQ